jgi:hypothetical protein
MFTSQRIRKAAKEFKANLKKTVSKDKEITNDKTTPVKAKEDKSKKETKK